MAEGSLENVGLFQNLSAEQRQAIERLCRWRRYNRGEQIIDRDSDTGDVFFVVSGSVRVVHYSLNGREVTLDDFGPGSCFGELAAVDGQPRSADVVALEDCLVASLSPDRFVEVLENHSAVAMQLIQDLVSIVRRSTSRIVGLTTLGSNARVLHEVLRIAEKGESMADGTVVVQPVPVHGVIASRIGTTRETVARVMNDLARKDILKRQRDTLYVLDMDRLTEMAEDAEA